MKSRTNASFRKLLAELPRNVREQAVAAYLLFRENPWHPSLHFKRVHPTKPIMSVRVGGDYRAVGIQRERAQSSGTGSARTPEEAERLAPLLLKA